MFSRLPQLPRAVSKATSCIITTRQIHQSLICSDLCRYRDVIYNDASELVGKTPMVRLNKVTKGLPAEIAVKVEYFNPACSIKDRIGWAMLEDAEKRGKISPEKTILIEPTSGNLGIGLAFACAVKGYKLVLVMPASMSVERRTIMKAFGAEVVLTDPLRAVKASMERVEELKKAIPGAYVLDQYSNPVNTKVHYETTGAEIWEQTQGKVGAFVFGVGSGGTLTGVGKYLKEKNPKVGIYAVEPAESQVIHGKPHSPHKIQGMGVGFIPEILEMNVFDECLVVKSQDAIDMAKRIGREEGLLAGISGGANVIAAIELAKRPEYKGKLIVTGLASFGERYLSTDLYKNLKEESDKMKETTVEEDLAMLKKKFNF
uniref:Cysteine synthase n=1 Tax=Acrobeloides nanus TaxID=290746 RepID=A0A914CNU9_9BILA